MFAAGMGTKEQLEEIVAEQAQTIERLQQQCDAADARDLFRDGMTVEEAADALIEAIQADA